MAAVVAVAAAPVAAADALVVVADDVIEKEFFVWIEFKSIFLKYTQAHIALAHTYLQSLSLCLFS